MNVVQRHKEKDFQGSVFSKLFVPTTRLLRKMLAGFALNTYSKLRQSSTEA